MSPCPLLRQISEIISEKFTWSKKYQLKTGIYSIFSDPDITYYYYRTNSCFVRDSMCIRRTCIEIVSGISSDNCPGRHIVFHSILRFHFKSLNVYRITEQSLSEVIKSITDKSALQLISGTMNRLELSSIKLDLCTDRVVI